MLRETAEALCIITLLLFAIALAPLLLFLWPFFDAQWRKEGVRPRRGGYYDHP